jgi:4-alpha-glucanotransferase
MDYPRAVQILPAVRFGQRGLLKGDLPVLVSRDSADVWAHPAFFKLDFAAGAPPDMYCAKGQRWGMPTYRWDNISRDGYTYIKEKTALRREFLRRAAHRPRGRPFPHLEHTLFRSPGEPGIEWIVRSFDENLWEEHGRRILGVLIKNTRMLLCAEDLGVIPACCTRVLLEFGIPGNDVQRWVKDWNRRHDFLPGAEYRRLSVAMLSTHDTTNWKAWWLYEAGTVDEGLFSRKCLDRG